MKALFVSGISHSDIPAIRKVPCEALLIHARHVCIDIRISLCTLFARARSANAAGFASDQAVIFKALFCDDLDPGKPAVQRELDRIREGAGEGIYRVAVAVDHDLTAAGADLLQNPRCRIGGVVRQPREIAPVLISKIGATRRARRRGSPAMTRRSGRARGEPRHGILDGFHQTMAVSR